MTLIADSGVSDKLMAEAEAVFEPDELAALLYAIACINAWNRLAIAGRRPVPGSYEHR